MTAENMQEEETKTWSEELSVAGSELKATVERLAKDVTIHHIVVKSPNGNKLFELPAFAGAAAAVFLGPYALIALGASIIAQFKIEVVRRETPQSLNEDIEISVSEVDPMPAEPEVEATPKAKAAPSKQMEEDIAVEDVPVMEAVESADSAETTTAPDDLRKLMGVGKKYAEALANNGYDTYASIAEAKPKALKAALEAAGINRKSNHATWPKQAKLAAAGKWKKLAKFQEELKAK